MAGTNIDKKIVGWLLEYVYKIAWNAFQTKKNIDEDCTRDVIQWLVSQPTVIQTCSTNNMRLQMLLILSRLTDGENYETRYCDENNWTVLEDLLVSFKGLSVNLPVSYRPKIDSTRNLIMKQAVLVCCREGDFDTAETVFERLSSDFSDKTVVENLKAVLNVKWKDHKYVASKLNSYSSLVSEFITLFSQISNEFNVPFLIQLAEAQERREIKRSKQVISGAKPLQNGGRTTQEKKLRTLQHVSKNLCASRGENSLALTEDGERDMQNMLKITRARTLDTLVADVSPTKRTRSDEDTPSKHTWKVPSPPTMVSTPKRDNKGQASRADIDISPSRTPKGTLLYRYKKNQNRQDRHKAVDKSDNAKNDSSDSADSDDGDELRERVSKVRNYHNDSFFERTKQPPSPTGSTFSTRKVPWCQKETEEFYQAVQEFGVGRWCEIRGVLKTFRTNVHLKDRWRTIHKTGQVDELEKQFGPV